MIKKLPPLIMKIITGIVRGYWKPVKRDNFWRMVILGSLACVRVCMIERVNHNGHSG